MPLIYSPADLGLALAGAFATIMPYLGVALVAVISVFIGLIAIRLGLSIFRWGVGEKPDMVAHYKAIDDREYYDDTW